MQYKLLVLNDQIFYLITNSFLRRFEAFLEPQRQHEVDSVHHQSTGGL